MAAMRMSRMLTRTVQTRVYPDFVYCGECRDYATRHLRALRAAAAAAAKAKAVASDIIAANKGGGKAGLN